MSNSHPNLISLFACPPGSRHKQLETLQDDENGLVVRRANILEEYA